MNYFKIIDSPKYRTSELLQKCGDKFKVWSYYDDEKLDKDFLTPEKETTRYFKKEVEADENLANKSANDLEKDGVKGVTLRERIIMELQYFEETGKHLDIKNWTLCSGSRDSDGGVPSAGWSGGGFRVFYYYRNDRDPSLCAREAVSLEPSNLIPSALTGNTNAVTDAIEIVKKAGYLVYKKY